MEQIKDLMKNIVSCVSAQATNLESTDTKELSEAMDMIKDLAMAEYYCAVTKAMEDPDNKYGVDWDENGPIKKGYSNNRMMNQEYPISMDYRRGYSGTGSMSTSNGSMNNGSMYYTEDSMRNMNNGSRYESARRGYEEKKDMGSLNRIFDVIEADMKELKPSMTAQDIQTAKQRLMSLSNMI